MSQLYAIFTALPTGVLLLDGEGRITRANPAAKALLGEPLEGQAWRQIIDRCFQPREDDGHEISFARWAPGPAVDPAAAGSAGPAGVHQRSDRNPPAARSHQPHEAVVRPGNMAASLAHQIRTPLSAAMLYAANLANRTLKPESRSQFQQS